MHKRVIHLVTTAWLTLFAFSCADSVNPPDFNEQLKKDLATIDAYLLDHEIEAQADPDNLIRYVIHQPGAGDSPTLDSCITTHYKGRLLDNQELFDSGENFSFALKNVIEGWRIALPLLKEGDSVTLYIPSGLAYGYFGLPVNKIPSNSNVSFDVKLLTVGKTYKSSPVPEGGCN